MKNASEPEPTSGSTDTAGVERALRALTVAEIVRRAQERRAAVPAFNIAYLPMVEPTVSTLKACRSFGIVEVARPDIERFGAEGYEAVAWAFARHADRAYARLHQDHVPVIDEEQRRVDWRPLIEEALALSYDSVMIDGSRLPLADNIAATRAVVEMAHPRAAVEAELGAVLGHEPGPLPPYEELFASGRGFTDIEDAARFAEETQVDWLSVSAGNIHGAISGAAKDERKIEARLDVERIQTLAEKTGIPLVLHGGTGIKLEYLLPGIAGGITKINIGTATRQPYEACLARSEGIDAAKEAVASAVAQHLRDYGIVGSAEVLASPS